MQDEIVRCAIADVGVAVQIRDVHARVREARLAELDHAVGDAAVLAVVDQREMDRAHRARLASRGDGERELAKAPLEEPQVRAMGDDADLQRGGKHVGRGVGALLPARLG